MVIEREGVFFRRNAAGSQRLAEHSGFGGVEIENCVVEINENILKLHECPSFTA